MHALKLIVLMTVHALMIGLAAAQTPNFSGTWSHTGNAKAQWVSMAGINCGPECTITQNDKTLTLTRPANQSGAPDTGLVVLNLDGSDSTVTQSNGSKFVVHVKWDAGKLVVTHEYAYFTIKQTLSLTDGKLTIINDLGVGDPPVRDMYVKK
jgi:hypothetical protein